MIPDARPQTCEQKRSAAAKRLLSVAGGRSAHRETIKQPVISKFMAGCFIVSPASGTVTKKSLKNLKNL